MTSVDGSGISPDDDAMDRDANAGDSHFVVVVSCGRGICMARKQTSVLPGAQSACESSTGCNGYAADPGSIGPAAAAAAPAAAAAGAPLVHHRHNCRRLVSTSLSAAVAVVT